MQAKAGMKLGINNDVNLGEKKQHCSLWMEGHQKLIRQTVILQTRYIRPQWQLKTQSQQMGR